MTSCDIVVYQLARRLKEKTCLVVNYKVISYWSTVLIFLDLKICEGRKTEISTFVTFQMYAVGIAR